MLKTLLKSVREYKLPAILSPIFVMLETALECIIPFVTAKLIDNLYAKEMGQIYILAVILFGLAILALTFGFFAARFTFCASNASLAASRATAAVSSTAIFSTFASSDIASTVAVRMNDGHPRSTASPAVTEPSNAGPEAS